MRRKGALLTASPVTAPGFLDLVSGERVRVLSGGWAIFRGAQAIDYVPGDLSERYEIVDAGALSVPPAVCQRLELPLGLGATKSPEALVAAVGRLAAINIGQVSVDFTPGQLEELAYRAKKRGHTIAEEIRSVVDRIKDEIFWRG